MDLFNKVLIPFEWIHENLMLMYLKLIRLNGRGLVQQSSYFVPMDSREFNADAFENIQIKWLSTFSTKFLFHLNGFCNN